MNYDDHLSRFEAKQREIEALAEQERRNKLVALHESIREADEIINAMIVPEFETLRAALVKHGFRAKITCTREVSELSPDSTFDIEIELREDIHPDNPRRGISFIAVPHGKYFTVRTVCSMDRQQAPSSRDLRFAEMTPEAVQQACASFVSRAFPV